MGGCARGCIARCCLAAAPSHRRLERPCTAPHSSQSRGILDRGCWKVQCRHRGPPSALVTSEAVQAGWHPWQRAHVVDPNGRRGRGAEAESDERSFPGSLPAGLQGPRHFSEPKLERAGRRTAPRWAALCGPVQPRQPGPRRRHAPPSGALGGRGPTALAADVKRCVRPRALIIPPVDV